LSGPALRLFDTLSAYPQSQVAALKSARDHVDKAIAMIEQKWRP
jgi:hypothetical protein